MLQQSIQTGSPLSIVIRRPYEKPYLGKKITARAGAVPLLVYSYGGDEPDRCVCLKNSRTTSLME